MAYNFTPYRPQESRVEPGSLGTKIVSLLLQGKNMEQENAFRMDIAKQRELDRITEQQHQQKLAELASTFPTSNAPESYDQAVSGFSDPQANIYDAQNKWIGQHAGEFAKYKGGIQLLNQFQQLADNTRMVQMGSEMRSLANNVATRRMEIARRFGEYNPENEVRYNTDKSYEEIQKDFARDNITFKEVPSGVIDERGFINRPKLFQWKGMLQEEQLQTRNAPNTEFERNLQRVRELEKILPLAQSQEEDSQIREEIKWRRDRLGRTNSPTAELSPEHRAMWSAERKQILMMGGADMQSKLAELDARFGLSPESTPPQAATGIPSGPPVQNLLPTSKKPYIIRSIP